MLIMRHTFRALIAAALLVLCASHAAVAQTQVQVVPPATLSVALVPISATTAVNNATTLTIPAPPAGMSNYVCMLAYSLSQDATSTVQTNAGATSTNFNSFALTVSLPATANLNSDVRFLWSMSPASGCPKSTIPGTATTFVQTAAALHMTWTWYALYYQAP